MENFSTKSDVIIDLQKKGYELDYVVSNENLLCVQDKELLNPDDFEIVESYRIENEIEQEEGCVIYAINSIQNGLKGILMIAYSGFAHGVSIHLWSKLSCGLN